MDDDERGGAETTEMRGIRDEEMDVYMLRISFRVEGQMEMPLE